MKTKPYKEGRYWVMPDGSLVPYIAGGSDGDGAGESDGGGGAAAGGNDDTGGVSATELESLQKEIRSARAEAAKYRRQLRDKEDALDGVDVEKYNALIQQEEAAKAQKLEEKGKYEELMAEHQRRSEMQLNKSNETLSMWKGRYEEQVVDNVLINSSASKAVDPREAVTLLRSNYKFNITDSGDVEIQDRDGTIVLDDNGTPATPAGVMSSFLEKRPHLCKPQGGGSGSRGGGSPSKKDQASSDPNLTGAQRIAAALKSRMA